MYKKRIGVGFAVFALAVTAFLRYPATQQDRAWAAVISEEEAEGTSEAEENGTLGTREEVASETETSERISEKKSDTKYSRVTQAGYQIEIRDTAMLLEAEEAEALLDEMEGVGAYTNAAFVTYRSSLSTREYVDKYFYQDGFFRPGGVVFAINMQERMLNLRFGGDMSRKLGYSRATSIEDNVYQYATKGDYYQCASSVFEQVTMLCEGQWIAQPMKAVVSVLLGLCIGMMALFLRVRGSRTQKRAAGSLLAGSIGAAALGSAVKTSVYKRVYSDSDSGGGGGGGFSGGGGGSGGGAGHSF